MIAWVIRLKDRSIIEKLKRLRENQNEAGDWWDEISEVEKASIDRGLEDIKHGRITPHEKVRKKYAKWLTKV